jgi:hypothetical protein
MRKTKKTLDFDAITIGRLFVGPSLLDYAYKYKHVIF